MLLRADENLAALGRALADDDLDIVTEFRQIVHEPFRREPFQLQGRDEGNLALRFLRTFGSFTLIDALIFLRLVDELRQRLLVAHGLGILRAIRGLRLHATLHPTGLNYEGVLSINTYQTTCISPPMQEPGHYAP